MDVKRYRVDYRHGIVEDDGSHDYWPATTSVAMVPASAFDTVLKELYEQCRLHGIGSEREAKLMAERDALQGKLKVAVGALEDIERGNPENAFVRSAIEALAQIGDKGKI